MILLCKVLGSIPGFTYALYPRYMESGPHFSKVHLSRYMGDLGTGLFFCSEADRTEFLISGYQRAGLLSYFQREILRFSFIPQRSGSQQPKSMLTQPSCATSMFQNILKGSGCGHFWEEHLSAMWGKVPGHILISFHGGKRKEKKRNQQRGNQEMSESPAWLSLRILGKIKAHSGLEKSSFGYGEKCC